MGQKSEFVSAFDIAAAVFKKLANAVMDAGGGDSDLRRLETDSGLRRTIAELIVGAASRIFLISCAGPYKTSELIRQGQYDWHNDWITDERFPIQKHPAITKQIELVEFDHDPSSEEVLAEFERRGLKRPTYEDALHFGIQHKDMQRKNPVVFLHEPVLSPDGSRYVLVLVGDAVRRNLSLNWFGYGWRRFYYFAGVRESMPVGGQA